MTDTNNTITKKLTFLQQKQFTGILNIQSTSGLEWRLYFYCGKLLWSNGGKHPYRSWLRHLAKYCPQINLCIIGTYIKESNQFEERDYQIVEVLLQKNRVKLEQLQALVTSKLIEVIFDILQKEAHQKLNYTYRSASEASVLSEIVKISPVQVNVEQVIKQTQLSWSAWSKKGIKSYSPNLAPSIKERSQLRQEVSEVVCNNLVRWVDGKNTLRDLAFNLNKDVLMVFGSLVPYLRKGLLELVEVDDLGPSRTLVQSPTDVEARTKLTAKGKKLITCIDDSPQICQVMKQILNQAGYQVNTIQEPLQAIPGLISSNPDLIFLDIGMPVINGYDICIKLKRISQLKDIPVIMLTASSGLLDQMRAQVVGASGFIPKPIEETKILNTVNKF